jgi:NADPH:quinone reductase
VTISNSNSNWTKKPDAEGAEVAQKTQKRKNSICIFSVFCVASAYSASGIFLVLHMQVIEITQFGAPDVLRLAEWPDAVAGAGEVLIRVAASGVNRPDVLQRMGGYPVPPGASDIPGLEIAGEIVGGDEAAMRQAGFKLGDQVCALVAGGGYAKLCSAPVGSCLPIPRGLTMVQAASLPETFFTVWSNVFDRGQLKSGESFLVQGGTSGIGVTAIQMAKAFGATVIATAGSDEKCEACLSLGADHAINYKTQDFAEQVKRITGAQAAAGVLSNVQGGGVNVILDMVAGDYVAKEVECLAEEGRLVIIAVQGGLNAHFNAGMVLRRRLQITGSTLRPRPVSFKAAIAKNLRQHVWPLIESGRIKPVLFKSFSPSSAAQAHQLMESNQHIGKIVLDWSA